MSAGLPLAAMTDLRARAGDLAGRALEPNIFADPAFLLPAATHLPRNRRPRFLLAWDPHRPDRLIGLCGIAAPVPGLPLSAWLHPQATAAFPLLDAEQPEAALAALLAQAEGRLRPSGLILHGMPADGPTMRLIAAQPGWSAAVIASRSRAVVRRAPPLLAGKAGKEFRRQARRLADLGKLTITATSDAAAVARAFELFLHLEVGGWKGRRGTALLQDRGRAAFVRAMVAALAQDGRCRIDTLALDGCPVAMGIVLRSGDGAYFWKTAFDERYARFSPGAHLAAAMGERQGREPGLAITDSCAIPGHAMIDRLWPERRTVVDLLLAPTPTLSTSGQAIVGIEQARRAARARLARWWAALDHGRAPSGPPRA